MKWCIAEMALCFVYMPERPEEATAFWFVAESDDKLPVSPVNPSKELVARKSQIVG